MYAVGILHAVVEKLMNDIQTNNDIVQYNV